jgi:phosphatidylserine decarboxylase
MPAELVALQWAEGLGFMAKSLSEWYETEVRAVEDAPMRWLSENYFFRDPSRPLIADPSFFLSPADGVVIYQKVVEPDESVIEMKGRPYSLRDALRDSSFAKRSLVVGIFMTFYDVHVNRIPLAGTLSYRHVDPLVTHNAPMLDVEKELLEKLRIPAVGSDYLYKNQRVINRVDSASLGQSYYLIQLADYDVDCILPFEPRPHHYFAQGERFSQIRYGSQVDLVVPLSPRFELRTLVQVGMHVEAGVDALLEIVK